jgi:hypothetical protein
MINREPCIHNAPVSKSVSQITYGAIAALRHADLVSAFLVTGA